MGTMIDSYWNEEDDREIICPYCGEKYTPTYEETIIGDKCVDCYTEEVQTVTCDSCAKKFTIEPSTTLVVAIDTIQKFQKIEQIMKSKKMDAFNIGLLIPKDMACVLHEIKEVLEDGS